MARRTQLSFATFNLLNLNIPLRPIYSDTDGWDQQTYGKKLAWSAEVLKRTNAHVWGFQELWHTDALTQLFAFAGLTDAYDILVPPNHTGDKIICAAAVKKGLLVGEPKWLTDFPDKMRLESSGDDLQTEDINVSISKFSRPTLKFKVKPRANGRAISVYVAHLKSKSPTRLYRESWYRDNTDYYKKHQSGLGYAISTIRRSAEAAALRMYIVDELKNTDTPLVVLGDLNDGQLSNTLNILTGQPTYLVSGLKGGVDDGL